MPKSRPSPTPPRKTESPTSLSQSPPPSTSTSTAPTTASKRLLHELSDLKAHSNPALLHLGPISDSQLLEWEAVLKGPPPTTHSPYTNGLWLLSISVPPSYPRQPPTITFRTPICHPNVAMSSGEICLSLLTSEHWSPMYTLSASLGAVQQLLLDPVSESPLNVDVANLYRAGDLVGAESLVRFWTAECRWSGEGVGWWISQNRQGSGGKLDE